MPKPYPREFRDDVVRVARDREPGVTVEQIAKDDAPGRTFAMNVRELGGATAERTFWADPRIRVPSRPMIEAW